MIGKILVPVDINATANSSVLNYASNIASKLKAELSIVYISGSSSNSQSGADICLDAIAKEGKSDKNRVISSRDMLKVLAAFIEKENIGLVALVDNALPEINRNKLSDTGMKLLRQTKVPVLLIRTSQLTEQRNELIKKIIVPLDGTEDIGPIIEYVTEIASAFMADVILLNVVPPEGREPVVASSTFLNHQNKVMEEKQALSSHYLSKIVEQFKHQNEEIKVVCETRVGSATAEIVNCADDLGADLMAISTRGHTGLRRWVFGSIATEVIRHYNKNLLLISQ